MPGGSREDGGGGYQQYDGYQQDRGGGGYNRDRGYGGGGRQDRYNQDSRYDNKPQVNESGIHRIEDTVYINNLPQDVTEEKLAEHFGSIGIIKIDKKLKKPKIWIYVDKTTNLPKGDATLTYDDPPSADAAIKWFGGKEFMGNIIQVTKAERKMTIPPERGSGGFERRGGGSGGAGRGGFRDNAGRGGFGGGGAREPREGDWSCDGCGANNFSRRDECFKCHAQKPGGVSSSSSSSRRGGGGAVGGYRGGGGSDRGGSDRGGSDRGGSDRGGRDRYDDRGRSGGGGRDDYRKDSRHERRDRPY